ncbi:MAG: cyanophycinase [Bacteroidetes bacterium]|nr:cyanophycinase [Bacteroidota bacterium]MBU1113942.1 cyanophycinase [Bacteroidota bacterium]MBU1798263.1 cyanophycinase [Bacteroidota bacterium]
MKNHLVILLFLIISNTFATDNNPKGHLVIIGGGERPDYITNKMLELSGGSNTKIVIIPMASSVPMESALEQKDDLNRLGYKNVEIILCDNKGANSDSVLSKIKDANLVYFTGGDQVLLTKALLGTKLIEKIKDIYINGGVIGGTSAGAAVMSKIMITGDELLNSDSSRTFAEIRSGNIETVEGFGFVDLAIIDQHFILRKRHNRLLTVVLENPQLLGVGIDESTSIIVNPNDTFEVLGEREVIVYDASNSKDISINPIGLVSASNMKMHILNSGKKFDLKNKTLFK